MTITIRAAVPDDYQAICALFPNERELFLVYPKGKYPLTVKQVKKLIRRRIEPTVLLAEGKVAGFANLYGYKKGRSAYVGNVVIDRLQRGRGLGKKIVVHLIDQAFRKYDLPRVRISVNSDNVPALLLYTSLGFKPYAVRETTDLKGGRVALIHLRLAREAFAIGAG